MSAMDDDQLERIAILAPLSKRDRQRFVKDGIVLTFAPGEAVVREGDPAIALPMLEELIPRLHRTEHEA